MRPLSLLLAALCGWLSAPILRAVGITFAPTPLAAAIGAIGLACWLLSGACGGAGRRPARRRTARERGKE